jgi:hypothetical protein
MGSSSSKQSFAADLTPEFLYKEEQCFKIGQNKTDYSSLYCRQCEKKTFQLKRCTIGSRQIGKCNKCNIYNIVCSDEGQEENNILQDIRYPKESKIRDLNDFSDYLIAGDYKLDNRKQAVEIFNVFASGQAHLDEVNKCVRAQRTSGYCPQCKDDTPFNTVMTLSTLITTPINFMYASRSTETMNFDDCLICKHVILHVIVE